MTPLKDILAQHPAPWTYSALGAAVAVTDAKGQEVPLFTLLDFVTQVTAAMRKKPAPASL